MWKSVIVAISGENILNEFYTEAFHYLSNYFSNLGVYPGNLIHIPFSHQGNFSITGHCFLIFTERTVPEKIELMSLNGKLEVHFDGVEVYYERAEQ